jgi:hypothetical protein
MSKHTKLVRSFDTKSDNGKRYSVFEYQDYEEILTAGNTINVVEGVKTWKTTTGLLLSQTNDPKVFTIIRTNETIREI